MCSTRPPLAALLAVVLLALIPGCDAPGSAAEEVSGAAGALHRSRRGLAFDFARRGAMPHGVAGDERFVFLTEPLDGRVVALSRFRGRELAEVPPPPGGFLVPFALRVPSPGRLAVLDSGGLPDPSGALPIAAIHEYDYTWDRWRRRLAIAYVRTLPLLGAPTPFTEDFEPLPGGGYVVSESVLGALWVVEDDGTVRAGVVPASFAPEDGIEGLAPCGFPPGVTLDGIPFEPIGMFAPGVSFLTSDDAYLYFGNTCAGGLRRLPLAALRDDRPPPARGASIELVSPPLRDGIPDVLKGLDVDRYLDPGALYALDALRFQVVRIDVVTGAREVVAGPDARRFDFPVAATVLPPVGGFSPLVVVSDQEHRWTGINAALTEDRFRPPFVVAKVLPGRR